MEHFELTNLWVTHEFQFNANARVGICMVKPTEKNLYIITHH